MARLALIFVFAFMVTPQFNTAKATGDWEVFTDQVVKVVFMFLAVYVLYRVLNFMVRHLHKVLVGVGSTVLGIKPTMTTPPSEGADQRPQKNPTNV